MHVGVFLKWISILYVRSESSPCTWGCFLAVYGIDIPEIVFPMHVGVFLLQLFYRNCKECLPHARGGVS